MAQNVRDRLVAQPEAGRKGIRQGNQWLICKMIESIAEGFEVLSAGLLLFLSWITTG